jgi:small subunit ribosomal protein S21
MLIVKIKQGESIERAIKTLKSKVVKTKQNQILFDNRQFTKKSVVRRTQISKAKYIQRKKDNLD